eukprot:Clim_evm52s218 gene=Clim_evmTU52s218
MTAAGHAAAFVCALCGEVPDEPVVSRVSGAVFEKRLLLRYLDENDGKDPVNGKLVDPVTDVVVINPPDASLIAQPRPLGATTIPGMLKAFQSEWDSVVLENHKLKQQVYATRKELTHALFQYDAACRVIARLQKQTQTVAPDQLSSVKQSEQKKETSVTTNGKRKDVPSSTEADGDAEPVEQEDATDRPTKRVATEPAGITQAPEANGTNGAADSAVVDGGFGDEENEDEGPQRKKAKGKAAELRVDWEKIHLPNLQGTFEELTAKRKKKEKPVNLPSPEDVKNFKGSEVEVMSSMVCRLVTHSGMGRYFVDANPKRRRKTVPIYHQQLDSDSSGTKPKNFYDFEGHPEYLAVSEARMLVADSVTIDHVLIKDISTKGKHKKDWSIKWTDFLDTGVTPTGVQLHPCDPYAVAMSTHNWHILNCEDGTEVARGPGIGGKDLFRGGAVHPDGLILAMASPREICFYDLRTLSQVTVIPTTSPVCGTKWQRPSMEFSENGYHLATLCEDNSARIWDIRKLTEVRALEPPVSGHDRAPVINSLRYDASGQYLGVSWALGDTDGPHVVNVWHARKKFDQLLSVKPADMEFRDFFWAPDARLLFTGLESGISQWQ